MNDIPKDCVPEDMFNILLATDIHLGYNEKDQIRGNDSYVTFEEILQVASKRGVDMILLGGDLFHDNKPTMQCIYRCMTLIRRYCFGDKSIAIEFLSDQSVNFSHCVNPTVNYEDPNFNISIPIFSIHGNHDDPSGFNNTCSMDLLSTTGLINYFGKVDDFAHVDVTPLLMSKGMTKLAIYGLSYIKDDRLSRLFREKKVNLHRPEGEEAEWFNIFVLHQNRADRGVSTFTTEDMLPDFLDLVFWGHEHECRIVPEKSGQKRFFITQPGSPVATSLCEGEAEQKHIGILHVCRKNFNLELIKLETVRPFIFERIVLSQCTLPVGPDNAKTSDIIQNYATECVETMLRQVDQLLTGHPKQPVLPLIRLRIDYSDESQMFNTIRFGQQMAERIANPTDVVLLRREQVGKKTKDVGKLDRAAMDAVIGTDKPEFLLASCVEEIVERYFSSENLEEENSLQVLSYLGLGEAVRQYVQKDNKESMSAVVDFQMESTMQYLMGQNVTEDNIFEHLQNFKLMRAANPEEEVTKTRQMLKKTTSSQRRKNIYHSPEKDPDITFSDDNDSDSGFAVVPKATQRGRGSRRGRLPSATRATKPTRGRGRGARRGKEMQPTLQASFNCTNTSKAPSHGSKQRGAVFMAADSDTD